MLDAGASFSIYMVHGGTTFGLWSGADRPFKPDTSSYDYDAPISEAGWPTEKFFKTRELIAKYIQSGEGIPDPPDRNPVISFPAVTAWACAPLFQNLPRAVTDMRAETMEHYNEGYGCILYRVSLPAGPAVRLECDAINDVGLVFVDGQRVGFLDRRSRKFSLPLPERSKSQTLDILVEAMGRVNFGAEVHDRKGLHGPVRLVAAEHSNELTGWHIYRLPLDPKMLSGLRYANNPGAGPCFWRAVVPLDHAGDTFLDLRPWGKGVAWVNGHCLGRFWNIGPTQTMYVPGPWLKQGQNEIVVFDLLGPQKPAVAGLDKPILDQLRPELDLIAN